jgi:hypothetical protein
MILYTWACDAMQRHRRFLAEMGAPRQLLEDIDFIIRVASQAMNAVAPTDPSWIDRYLDYHER